MNQKVVVYGIGKAFDSLKKWGSCFWDIVEIVAIVDKGIQSSFEVNIFGNKVQVYKDILEVQKDYSYVIITSDKFFSEISAELKAKDINQEKIVDVTSFLYNAMLIDKIFLRLKHIGVDIGGPSSLFYTVYEKAKSCDIVNYSDNNVWSSLAQEYVHNGNLIGNVIISDATDLRNIDDESYDFVLSSNNLEHIANPFKALLEWKRILKKDGLLIIAVPNKEYTFDHKREVTKVEHLMRDYKNEILEDDLTHVEEILELHDLSMDAPAGSFEEFRERCYNNYDNRCLHQHVFDSNLLCQSAHFINMEIVKGGIEYSNNHIIILKKH